MRPKISICVECCGRQCQGECPCAGDLLLRENDPAHPVRDIRDASQGQCSHPLDFFARPEKLATLKPAKPTIAGVVHGAAGIVKAVKNHATRTDPPFLAMVERRTSICAECSHAVKNKLGGFSQCDLCGCATWAKVRNPNEHCPDTPPRWSAENLEASGE